ncbi:MAG: hypothetical protein AAF846_06755 [Chloroflexota bacterium]
MRRLIIIIYSLVLLLLTACADTGTSLTVEANYAFAGTQVADLRLTATVQAARARTTLDFMGTRASRAATQSRFFEETLVATGFSPDVLATQREVALGSSPTPQATLTPIGNEADETPNTVDASPQPFETFTPTPPQVTLNAPASPFSPTSAVVPQPTPDLGSLTLGNIVTASSAGDDGCGAGITSTFTTNTQEIYVIVPAFNITANAHTFAARWQRAGQAIGPIYDFTPIADTDQLCIWLFVDQTDFIFEAGNYSVSVDVNGQQVANIPFVIQ